MHTVHVARSGRHAGMTYYGHDDTQCVRTYASVTAPALENDVTDDLMDVADAVEAAGEGRDAQSSVLTPRKKATPADEAKPLDG